MRIWLVAAVGLVVGVAVGAGAAVAALAKSDEPSPSSAPTPEPAAGAQAWMSASPTKIQLRNVGASPLTMRWPDYALPNPPADTMIDRFTIDGPSGWCWFTRARTGDLSDIEVRCPGHDVRSVDPKELLGVKALLPDWEKHAVAQRKLDTGCIPTGYEYLLRSAGAEGVAYATFQDDFDLGASNDYASVANAVRRKYPQVEFGYSSFQSSDESIRFLERAIDEGRPIVLTIFSAPNNCHIVPVLGHDEKWVYYLQLVNADGGKDVRAIRRWELARRDQEWTQSQIAWLETKSPR